MSKVEPILENSRMIHKANQIAAYFKHYPEDRAIEGVADHLQKFWPPKMRAQLLAYIEDEQGADLEELVIKAAKKLG